MRGKYMTQEEFTAKFPVGSVVTTQFGIRKCIFVVGEKNIINSWGKVESNHSPLGIDSNNDFCTNDYAHTFGINNNLIRLATDDEIKELMEVVTKTLIKRNNKLANMSSTKKNTTVAVILAILNNK